MASPSPSDVISDVETLERLYGVANPPSLLKEVDYIHLSSLHLARPVRGTRDEWTGWARRDPPRGDPAGFVHVEDDRTLLLPDRRGNNRLDSLRNILTDPRVALLFLVPGTGETLRVNGRAVIVITPALLERFAMDGKPPRSVLRITVETGDFHALDFRLDRAARFHDHIVQADALLHSVAGG